MGSVLDTKVVIEIAAGNKRVLDEVLALDSTFCLTAITRFELLLGDLTDEERFWIGQLTSLPFDDKASDVAAYLFKELRRQGKPLSLRDLFIGAICISQGMRLITMDRDLRVLEGHGLELHLVSESQT
ncbi:MAG: type II toxin-antitoxin system VapC family toxin [Candidatus Korarchaeum sp.]|nr:type II toxin-antitoxin system VapC family toxin [Candidatus Korarchaeum sp.]MDW8034869.1 type II toxin-antitoxin system VapC family toxin [Candidatus Korarchaeum sp.]